MARSFGSWLLRHWSLCLWFESSPLLGHWCVDLGCRALWDACETERRTNLESGSKDRSEEEVDRKNFFLFFFSNILEKKAEVLLFHFWSLFHIMLTGEGGPLFPSCPPTASELTLLGSSHALDSNHRLNHQCLNNHRPNLCATNHSTL